MHFRENTLFDLDLGAKVTRNDAQYPIHVTYTHTKSEVDMSNCLGIDAVTRKCII